jgi:Na+/H+ antiporter NhaA
VCVCACVYVHVCMCVCMCACVCMCVHVCVCVVHSPMQVVQAHAFRPSGALTATQLCEHGVNNQRVFVILLLAMLACSWFTEAVGVHAIFGAFIFGLLIPRTNHNSHELTRKIEDLTVSLLLPLYFVKSGLKTQVRLRACGWVGGCGCGCGYG